MNKTFLFSAGLLSASLALPATAQQNEVTIKAQKLTDSVYVLFGQGGNIGLQFGKDGAYLIDDQFSNLSEKILAKVKEISGMTPKYVINTHYHFDHTGGNENMGKAGAIMVSHDNVRLRISKETFVKTFNARNPPTKKVGLPQVTFNEELSIHLNGEEARLYHIPNAHTDGDSIAHFKSSNVIHMGDTFFNGMYPFIDVSGGGSIHGVIKAMEKAHSLSNEATQIIPGHGQVTDKAGVKAYKEMLEVARDRIAKLKEAGKTLKEVQDANPMRDFDERYKGGGAGWNLLFMEFVYSSL
ncbi:MBL fold metallo-hydrolase [Temperatibacter marinus]|uniref:MBL fold metallo-hydrolase n=1 Tax=Temperatibacter marinus TaxID=1456591 RepID=A0AA52HAG7_9PROT|nr:MBL fold metallo-hydrolase [Temperatibacter marinus]WND03607.1 MBL fold metallo-hydrolase [Temperatibacter marinus]